MVNKVFAVYLSFERLELTSMKINSPIWRPFYSEFIDKLYLISKTKEILRQVNAYIEAEKNKQGEIN